MSGSVKPTGSRVASLADKLARPAASTPASGPELAPVRRVSPVEDSVAPVPVRPVGEGSKPGLRPVTVMVEVGLRERMRRVHDARGCSYRELILDAVEAGHPRLAELVAARGPVMQRGPLFTRVVTRPVAPVVVQVTVRMSGDEVAIIDSLIAESGAADRSALLNAVLADYLPE